MKEDYLTDGFVSVMRGRYYRESKAKDFLKSEHRFAIIGVDLQNFFLSEKYRAYLPSAPALIQKLKTLYSWAREREIKIILTRHCHSYPSPMARWWSDEMLCDTDKTEIHKELRGFGDVIVDKRTYNAFYNTSLENLLRDKNVDTVIITGVMTHLCCESTAREAFVRGFNVIFPVDGTATQNAKMHECSLCSLAHGFALTPAIEDVMQWI